jgi:translation initiation factor 1 (eIF-1/SUI1)
MADFFNQVSEGNDSLNKEANQIYINVDKIKGKIHTTLKKFSTKYDPSISSSKEFIKKMKSKKYCATGGFISDDNTYVLNGNVSEVLLKYFLNELKINKKNIIVQISV